MRARRSNLGLARIAQRGTDRARAAGIVVLGGRRLLTFAREDGAVARMAVVVGDDAESTTTKIPPVREEAETVPAFDLLAQSGMSSTRVDVRPDHSRWAGATRTPIPMTIPIPMPSAPLPTTSRSPLARAAIVALVASVLAAGSVIAVSAKSRPAPATEPRASTAETSPPLRPEAPPPPVAAVEPAVAAETAAPPRPRHPPAPRRRHVKRRPAPRAR